MPDKNPTSPEGFNEKVDHLNALKNSPEGLGSYRDAITQIRGILQGDDSENVRQLYPGWSNEDFEILLSELGESQSPHNLPSDYDSLLLSLQNMKRNDPYGFNTFVTDLRNLANGEDEANLRQYYPSWTRQNFRDLFTALGEAF